MGLDCEHSYGRLSMCLVRYPSYRSLLKVGYSTGSCNDAIGKQDPLSKCVSLLVIAHHHDHWVLYSWKINLRNNIAPLDSLLGGNDFWPSLQLVCRLSTFYRDLVFSGMWIELQLFYKIFTVVGLIRNFFDGFGIEPIKVRSGKK